MISLSEILFKIVFNFQILWNNIISYDNSDIFIFVCDNKYYLSSNNTGKYQNQLHSRSDVKFLRNVPT